MAQNEENFRILNCLKEILPNFSVTMQDIVHQRKEFVVSFYEEVLNWLKNEIAERLPDEQFYEDEVANTNTEFVKEVYLYTSIKFLFKLLGHGGFSINDIFDPRPKRSKFFIKLMLHLLVFISEYTPHIQNEQLECSAAMLNMQNMDSRKNESEQKLNEVAEAVGISKLTMENLKRDLKNLEDTYAMKMEEAEERKAVDLMNMDELQKLQSIVKNKLELLDSRKVLLNSLGEKVVTPDMYNTALSIEKGLKTTLATFEENDIDYEQGLKHKKLEYNRYVEALDMIDGLDIRSLTDIIQIDKEKQEKAKQTENNCQELKLKKTVMNKQILQIENEIKVLVEVEDTNLPQNLKTKEVLSKQLIKDKAAIKQHEHVIATVTQNVEELKMQIATEEEDYEQMTTVKNDLVQAFNDEYQAMLNAENEVVNTYNNALNRISEI